MEMGNKMKPAGDERFQSGKFALLSPSQRNFLLPIYFSVLMISKLFFRLLAKSLLTSIVTKTARRNDQAGF